MFCYIYVLTVVFAGFQGFIKLVNDFLIISKLKCEWMCVYTFYHIFLVNACICP